MTDLLFIGCFFSSIITAYILFFYTSSYQKYATNILGTLMLIYAYCAIAFLLISSKWIVYVPFLYKSAAPLNLLFAPLGYLYIRAVLENETKFSKKNLLHLIPFFIFLFSYLPFYFMPIEEKTILVKKVVENFSVNYESNDGIISESIFFIVRFIQAIIYIYFQVKLIYNAKKVNAFHLRMTHASSVMKWLKFFTFSFIMTIASLVILFIMIVNKWVSPQDDNFNFPINIISISFFSISIYLLLNPHILYGIPFVGIDKLKIKQDENDPKLEEKEIKLLFASEIEKIEKAFNNDQIYLKPNLSVVFLAGLLEVSSRNLSFIINKYYNLRYNDFINKYRIEYVLSKMKEGYLEKHTIESLYFNAGFINKATFNSAFKKLVIATPSEYLQEMNNIANKKG